MIEIKIFISCGSEVSDLRDAAARVLKALERAFLWGLEIQLVIRYWDYRDEPPEVVPTGDFAARSLRMVQSSSAVIGILGPSIPRVTAQELLLAIQRYAGGQADRVWLFVDASAKGAQHRRFLRRIREETGMEAVYQEFADATDFQEKVFVALIPYVIRRAILDRQTVVSASGGGLA